MKTIGINIDGIIRDSYTKFDDQYRKIFIHNPCLIAMNENSMEMREFTEQELDEIDIKIADKEREMLTLPMDSSDFLNHYKFERKEIAMTADNFIMTDDGKVYENAPQDSLIVNPEEAFESFMYEDYALQIFAQAEELGSAMEVVNRLQGEGFDKKEYEVVLLSTCKKKAVPATYSFLALKNCRIKKLVFVEEDYKKWDYCDILIDCIPEAIQSKPDGKFCIKINKEFNQWDNADYSFDNIKEFHNSNVLRELL